MRNVIGGLVLSALVVGQAVPARAFSPGGEVGLAFASAGIDLVYVPAKAVTAVVGGIAGGVVGFLTGGDLRSANALWVPASGGTFVVTPAHLDGTKPLEFFGADYRDQPSRNCLQTDGSTIYEAAYSSM